MAKLPAGHYSATTLTRMEACRLVERLMTRYGEARDMEIDLLANGLSGASRAVGLYVVKAKNCMHEIDNQCGRLRSVGMWLHSDDLWQEACALRDLHDKRRAAVTKEKRK